uniref:C2 domain-containing protein n=1 Tax=Heliothis virescens TaxID=7102 RepID=A0A2A4IY55_HELVI
MPGKIKVKVLAGRNLPVMDRASDTTDAFVEIKFGSITHKTDVCRKSLNPHWNNTEWYRFEVDESELQDEPLQLRLMDHDTYSANDAIGKVVISLAPLLAREANNAKSTAAPHGGAVMSGWIPVFDTMHGIRGELNVIVKVELFSDFNKYKTSSCGVQFFHCPMIPPGYRATAIHGFVEELVVNDDPEYQWIDKIRTPRASNEARQVAFIKLSNQVQRLVGLKAAELGANAVVGYQQDFDLEGEAGVVARAIGTAVSISPLPMPSQPLNMPPCTQQQLKKYLDILATDNESITEMSTYYQTHQDELQKLLMILNPNASALLDVTDAIDEDEKSMDMTRQSSLTSYAGSVSIYRDEYPHRSSLRHLSEDQTDLNKLLNKDSDDSDSSGPIEKLKKMKTNFFTRRFNRRPSSKRSSIDKQDDSISLKSNASDTSRISLVDIKNELRKFKGLRKPKFRKAFVNKEDEGEGMASILARSIIHVQTSLACIAETQDSEASPGSTLRRTSESEPAMNISDDEKAKIESINEEGIKMPEIRFTSLSNINAEEAIPPRERKISESCPATPMPDRSENLLTLPGEAGYFGSVSSALSAESSEIESSSDEEEDDESSDPKTDTERSIETTSSVVQSVLSHNIDPKLMASLDKKLNVLERSSPDIKEILQIEAKKEIDIKAEVEQQVFDNQVLIDKCKSLESVPQGVENKIVVEKPVRSNEASTSSVKDDTSERDRDRREDKCDKDRGSPRHARHESYGGRDPAQAAHAQNSSLNATSTPMGIHRRSSDSDLSVTPKGGSLNTSAGNVGSGGGAILRPSMNSNNLDMLEYPFLTMSEYPPGFIVHIEPKTFTDDELEEAEHLNDDLKSPGLVKNVVKNILLDKVHTLEEEKEMAVEKLKEIFDKSHSHENLKPTGLVHTAFETVLLDKVQTLIPAEPATPSVTSETTDTAIGGKAKPKPAPLVIPKEEPELIDNVETTGDANPPTKSIEKSKSVPEPKKKLKTLTRQDSVHSITDTETPKMSKQANSPCSDVTKPSHPILGALETIPSLPETTDNDVDETNNSVCDNSHAVCDANRSERDSDRREDKCDKDRGSPRHARHESYGGRDPAQAAHAQNSSLNATSTPMGIHRRSSDSDLSVTPKGGSLNTSAGNVGSGGGAILRPSMNSNNLDMLEYPFLTMSEYPPGFIVHIGGTVCAREDVCVLSASGTAAVINLDCDFNAEPEPNSATSGSKNTIDDTESEWCSMTHVPYSPGAGPYRAELSTCGGCRRARVPTVLLATCSKPSKLTAYAKAVTLTAVAARVRRAPPTSEPGARDISDQLPFLEYELHKLLLAKLRMQGANALFSLQTQISIGERCVMALASGTACRLAALPPPTPPRIKASEKDKDALEIQKALWDSFTANRAANGFDIGGTEHNTNGALPEVEGEDAPALDLCADKDACVLELDEAEDVETARALAKRHVNMQVYTHGLKPVIGAPPQAFAQVWRGRLVLSGTGSGAGGAGSSAVERHVRRALDGVAYKLRRLQPCALVAPRFQLELPELALSGTGSGAGGAGSSAVERHVRRALDGVAYKLRRLQPCALVAPRFQLELPELALSGTGSGAGGAGSSAVERHVRRALDGVAYKLRRLQPCALVAPRFQLELPELALSGTGSGAGGAGSSAVERHVRRALDGVAYKLRRLQPCALVAPRFQLELPELALSGTGSGAGGAGSSAVERHVRRALDGVAYKLRRLQPCALVAPRFQLELPELALSGTGSGAGGAGSSAVERHVRRALDGVAYKLRRLQPCALVAPRFQLELPELALSGTGSGAGGAGSSAVERHVRRALDGVAYKLRRLQPCALVAPRFQLELPELALSGTGSGAGGAGSSAVERHVRRALDGVAYKLRRLQPCALVAPRFQLELPELALSGTGSGAGGAGSSAVERHVRRALDGVAYKLRRLQPCALVAPRFQLELPEDEIQLVVSGAAIPLQDPNSSEANGMENGHHPHSQHGSHGSHGSHGNGTGDADDDIFALDEEQLVKSPPEVPEEKGFITGQVPSTVSLTTLSAVSGGRVVRRLCALRLLFVRETTAVRELGGLSGFLHTFTCEVMAIVRAYTAALGGNALTSFYIRQLMLQDNAHKNQGQCLLSVGGDIVHITY